MEVGLKIPNMKILTPQQHSIRIIPVVSQNIDRPAHEIDILEDEDGNKYKVHHYFVYEKNEGISEAMLLAATGKHLTDKDVWNYYLKSDKIVFFVVEELFKKF